MAKLLEPSELNEIRAIDAQLMDLRFCPPAWQQRRALIQHIDALAEKQAVEEAEYGTGWVLPDGSVTFDPTFKPGPDILNGPQAAHSFRYKWTKPDGR
jgi:hypothetical protein